MRWRAEVRRKGVTESASFDTKAAAVAWATRVEAAIDAGKYGQSSEATFGDLLRRYADEVSPSKEGARWEKVRIHAITVGRPEVFPPVPPDPIASVRVADLDERHFSAWRDRRLRQVSAGTVLREWTLLSNACTVGMDEWRLLDRHPMAKVKRPKEPEPRRRRVSSEEIERITHCLGYESDRPPETMTARVGAVFLFAIETAMRAGEIAGLLWQDVESERRFLRTSGKTPAARREVPLSSAALRILGQMAAVRDGDSVFRVKSASLDALFRRAVVKSGIEGLHFHDTRHEAITRLAKVLDVLPLAKAIGHKDLRMLMVYYNPTAEELGKLLK